MARSSGAATGRFRAPVILLDLDAALPRPIVTVLCAPRWCRPLISLAYTARILRVVDTPCSASTWISKRQRLQHSLAGKTNPCRTGSGVGPARARSGYRARYGQAHAPAFGVRYPILPAGRYPDEIMPVSRLLNPEAWYREIAIRSCLAG